MLGSFAHSQNRKTSKLPPSKNKKTTSIFFGSHLLTIFRSCCLLMYPKNPNNSNNNNNLIYSIILWALYFLFCLSFSTGCIQAFSIFVSFSVLFCSVLLFCSFCCRACWLKSQCAYVLFGSCSSDPYFYQHQPLPCHHHYYYYYHHHHFVCERT